MEPRPDSRRRLCSPFTKLSMSAVHQTAQTDQCQDQPQTSFKSSPNQCGLLELPNELLLPIFKELSPSDLLSLAFLSRRLHLLALPLYLGGVGVLDDPARHSSCNVLLQSDTFSKLAVLRKSLCITSIAHLVCRFPSANARILSDVRSIHRLVSRLASVEAVTLDFYRFFSRQSEIPLKDWTNTFRDLLKALSNKSCTTLVIRYGDHPADAFIHPSYVDRNRPIALLSRYCHKIFTNSKNASTTSAIGNYGKAIFPLHVLNGSGITNLTLEYTKSLSPQEWAPILSGTTLPALSKLRICGCQIALTDLSTFLSRHPSITTLDLSRLAQQPPGSHHHHHHHHHHHRHASPRKSILPHLTSFTADLNITAFLLSAKPPSLESISVPLDLTYAKHQSQLGDVDSAFAGIAERPTTNKAALQVHLDISMDFDVDDDILMAREAEAAEKKKKEVAPWQYLVTTIQFNTSVRYPGMSENKLRFLPIWLERWFP